MLMSHPTPTPRVQKSVKPIQPLHPYIRKDPMQEAVKITVPTWPLQNTVAVNPFWNLRERHFTKVMQDLAPILHTKLYMPLDYYLDKFKENAISEEALASALFQAQDSWASAPQTIDDLVQMSKNDGDYFHKATTLSEYYDQKNGLALSTVILDEICKYASSYFDKGQALAKFPWRDSSFWRAWISAQQWDRNMEIAGISDFRQTIRQHSKMSAEEFIRYATQSLGWTTSRPVLSLYFSRLLARCWGWASQFQYVQWQKSLGYPMEKGADTVELLAVALAYEYGLSHHIEIENPGVIESWKKSVEASIPDENYPVHDFGLHQIWQTAFELTYQKNVAQQISISSPKASPASPRPRFQVAMCIDVRSEMFRRHLEMTSGEIATLGFAGFFGLPIDYKRIDEKEVQHRLPVLLSPALRIYEKSSSERAMQKIVEKSLFAAFFRNLRKAPLASFLYVELFGILSLSQLCKRWLKNFNFLSAKSDSSQATTSRSQVKRFDDSERLPQHLPMSEQAQIERAATVLQHMGLTENFAHLVVLAGHGSVTTNNAFASSLDCGACGGHAGDINARVLAQLLNSPAVRMGLKNTKYINIPDDTHFVAAVHETVTDEVYILDTASLPSRYQEDLTALRKLLTKASKETRKERQTARSPRLYPYADLRSQNWSEIRPEWGLAGNACFIVAPRAWSKEANFSSRSFLHDYDWRKDKTNNFATLELIMTAPMIVTNWINMQYYASTVAPQIYGAGSKVLHNLVNETGVLEGNSGDLRVGLPLQSVHDGEKFVHEPLRLSVFIAAPRAEIEKIIAQHQMVRELVDNEWLHILQIDDETQLKHKVTKRYPGGTYLPV